MALFAIGEVAAILTGCGDDENNNNNNNNGGGVKAPQTLAGKTYTFTTAGGGANATQTIAFAPQGNTFTISDQNGNVVQQGTYNVTTAAGANPLSVTLTPANGQATTVVVNTYTSAQSGTFTATGGIQGTGTFQEQAAGGTTAGGTTAGGTTAGGTTAGGTTAGGTTAGGTTAGGTTAGGTTGGATGVQGKTLQLNYQGGGGEKFQFTSATAASYENGADTATYTYNTTTGALHIVRSGGQTYDMVIPNGSTTGTTTVNYQEPGGTLQPSQASFTLT